MGRKGEQVKRGPKKVTEIGGWLKKAALEINLVSIKVLCIGVQHT